jgi:hemophore-related protein
MTSVFHDFGIGVDGRQSSASNVVLGISNPIFHSIKGEAAMTLLTRRALQWARAAAVALIGAMVFGGAATASAQPPAPPPAPANCSPADWAGVRAGVAAAVSAYLFTHPAVNDYFATLKGQSRDQIRPQLQTYFDANPQVRTDLEGIRQPAVDFLDRCR